MTLTAGATLQNGKYVIHTICDHQELEITYQATHSFLRQSVLIKALKESLRDHDDFDAIKHQLTLAATHLAQCQHPNLVRTLDCFEEDGIPYVVLESISGQSLDEVIRTGHPLSEETALFLMRQVGSAVSHIHDCGLVHGGITPQTLVRNYGTDHVILTGFGLKTMVMSAPSKASDPPSSSCFLDSADGHSSLLTREENPIIDLRALAQTLYFLLTGELLSVAIAVDAAKLRLLHPNLKRSTEHAIRQVLDANTSSSQITIDDWLKQLDISGSFDSQSTSFDSQSTSFDSQSTSFDSQSTSFDSQSTSFMRTQVVSPTYPAGVTPATTVISPERSPRVASSKPYSAKSKTRPWLLLGLGVTSVAAACAGAYLGFTLKFQDADDLSKSPVFGREIFGGEQNFPPSREWPGLDSTDLSESPRVLFERSESAPLDQPDESIQIDPLPSIDDYDGEPETESELVTDPDLFFDPDSISGSIDDWDTDSPLPPNPAVKPGVPPESNPPVSSPEDSTPPPSAGTKPSSPSSPGLDTVPAAPSPNSSSQSTPDLLSIPDS
ncbi:MAG: protein kinase domain-containing protein [Elainellaceae cyanobacterium]